jgi:hypothetical protein
MRKPLPQLWWIYGEKRPGLYRTIAPLERVLVIARVAKHLSFVFFRTKNIVFSDKIDVFAIDSTYQFAALVSVFHLEFAWKYGTTMGASTLSYHPSSIFDTFPLPRPSDSQRAELEALGERYDGARRALLTGLGCGLTDLYNLFHDPSVGPRLSPEVFALADSALEKQAGKGAVQLRRLVAGDLSRYHALARDIEAFRDLHAELDQAVAAAYGWDDLVLGHGFHEQDYLPETDRVRFTVSPAARAELLERLLKLNWARAAATL